MSQSKLYEAIRDKIESLFYKEKEVLYNKIGDKIMNNLASEQEIDIFFLLARYFFRLKQVVTNDLHLTVTRVHFTINFVGVPDFFVL